MMKERWVQDGEELARKIGDTIGAQFEQVRLTDKLYQYSFRTLSPNSAAITLLVSPYEIIVGAGRGTQFELEGLPVGRQRAIELSRAVAGGGLKEKITRRRVKSMLQLANGEIVRGGSVYLTSVHDPSLGWVTYEPYPPPDEDASSRPDDV